MMNRIPYKTYLTEQQLPDYWYNLRADMKEKHDPYLHPGTGLPLKADDMTPIFTDAAVKQELNQTERYISIPGGIMDFLKMYRPSPLVRAYALEEALNTPARIYYKYEGNNTSGSHKLNSAVPQVFYAKQQGLTSLTTETGAGQWGTALSMAAGYYGLKATVYMVKVSAEQKPDRREVMRTFGSEVIKSPSDTTNAGRAVLAKDPSCGGSLGCAISEAVEAALATPNCRYVLGSVLDHVLLHQAIIGSEAKRAMELIGETPDIVIGCAGGGSNLGGIMSEYMGERLQGKNHIRFVGVEPAACPSLTRGRYAYDFCDVGHVTPLAKMYTLGSGFFPSPIHAGGLRYHGMSPTLSKLYHDGYLDEARAYTQTQVFSAASVFIRTEGTLPAPESAHAIAAAIEEAKRCKETGEPKVILFNLTGSGFFDMAAYRQFNDGSMTDYIPTDDDLAQGFASLADIPANAR